MSPFARVPPIAALAVLLLVTGSRTLAAQVPTLVPEAVNLLSDSGVVPNAPPGVVPEPSLAPAAAWFPESPKRRPGAVVPLYLSYAALHALDVHSTTLALNRGAKEVNPLMQGIANKPAAMIAVKTAGTAGVIYAGEKLWKKSKTGAIIFMVAANAAIGWVVQHNYRALP